MAHKILIMGLPGAGKTTLGKALVEALEANRYPAILLDGDAVRSIDANVDFSEAGRIKQAARMAELADNMVRLGYTAVCSFVCPTPECRSAFFQNRDLDNYTIFVDRIDECAYPDTNKMFVPPWAPDFVVTEDYTVEKAVEKIVPRLGLYTFDVERPTALLVGRFQPFHAGHRELVKRAIADVGQVAIALRRTPLDEKNPYTTAERAQFITQQLGDFKGRFIIYEIPNVTKVVYGRTPGYAIEQYHIGVELEGISATKIRLQAETEEAAFP